MNLDHVHRGCARQPGKIRLVSDNPSSRYGSRRFGLIARAQILGKVILSPYYE